MSAAIIIVAVEGVLTDVDDVLPTAQPVLQAVQMISRLSELWQVGFVTTAPTELAQAWLREVRAPDWVWVAQAARPERVSVILRKLAERRDRCRFLFAGDMTGFGDLARRGVSTVLVNHSSTFALGDWRQPSNWDGNVSDVVDDDDQLEQ